MHIIKVTHIGEDYAKVEVTKGRTTTEYEVPIAVAEAITATKKAAFDAGWNVTETNFNAEYTITELSPNDYRKLRYQALEEL